MQSTKKDPPNPKVQAAIDLLLESGADLSTIFAQDGLLKVLTKNIVARALEADLAVYSQRIMVYCMNQPRNGKKRYGTIITFKWQNNGGNW